MKLRPQEAWAWAMVMLAGGVPFTYDMLRNIQLFTPVQLAASAAVVAAGTGAVALLAAGLARAVAAAGAVRRLRRDRLDRAVYGCAAALMLSLFLHHRHVLELQGQWHWPAPAVAAGLAGLFAMYWAVAAALGPKRTALGLLLLLAAGTVRGTWRIRQALAGADRLVPIWVMPGKLHPPVHVARDTEPGPVARLARVPSPLADIRP